MRTTREYHSLAGQWRCRLDGDNCGIRDRWFNETLPLTIALPGSTDEAGLGDLTEEACADRLSRVRRWIGPVWYQRDVDVPAAWADRRIRLLLERTKNSQVWIDDTWVGSDDSLSTAHEFDLTSALSYGPHRLTIRIDNAALPPVGPCHQVDERTQTNWNGILGRIELCVSEALWLRDLQAYPDQHARRIRLTATVVNVTAWSGAGTLQWQVATIGGVGAVATVTTGRLLGHGATAVEAEVRLPPTVSCWDEFTPQLLRVSLSVSAMPRATWIGDTVSAVCGLRNFDTSRGQFRINGRPTFLRGRVDSAIFPLTGYAPMDESEWLRLLSIAKSYGLNHYRFHSWCPPEAAFVAADRLGMYLLVELPNKREITTADNRQYRPPAAAYETLAELEGDGGPPAERTAYLKREGARILAAYGNHPSFVMLTLGNELGGDESVMREICDYFRSIDTRHRYAMGSGHFHWDIGLRAGDEFWVTRATGAGLPVRGASFESHGHIDHRPPSTTVDYAASLQGVPVPVITHENGEFEIYPDYREIAKYRGVLRARNFEIFRERLRAAGMLDQAADFFRASGALSVICHREDIEACLRTAGLGGFHLLDLMDFSGQGTALVGILDAFMDSKGLISAADWRQFCCETVPLVWMSKYTWTTDEVFRARLRIAHYGPAALPNQAVEWSLRDGPTTIAAGTTQAVDVPTGTVTEVDLICAALASVVGPRALTLAVELPHTPYRNRYDCWVYPASVDCTPPPGLRVARTLDDRLAADVQAGATAVVITRQGGVAATVAMAFQSGFWSPMFRMGERRAPDGGEVPGTQGILCNPDHPLFADFPTEYHSNWQWWRLVKHCDPLVLNDTPPAFRPIVQVIDGIDRNYKLGLIMEAKVGRGRILVCSIDLPALTAYPEARQLLAGLYRYAAGADFDPAHTLSLEALQEILRPTPTDPKE